MRLKKIGRFFVLPKDFYRRPVEDSDFSAPTFIAWIHLSTMSKEKPFKGSCFESKRIGGTIRCRAGDILDDLPLDETLIGLIKCQ